MNTVYLYGHLGRKFGHRWELDVSTPAEAVRAIIANRPDFEAYMLKHSAPGYHVFIGADMLPDEKGLQYPIGRQAIKIVPVVAGAAKSPWVGIVLGSLIIIAAVVFSVFTFGAAAPFLTPAVGLAIGMMGVSLVIGGVTQLLTKAPEAPTYEGKPNSASYIFGGAVNTVAQGAPVPLGYGRLRVGSAVISAGITTQDIAI